MGIFDNFRAKLSVKQDSSKESDGIIREKIEGLFHYLTSEITSSPESGTVFNSIKKFQKLDVKRQIESLTQTYLYVEKYLTEIDPDFVLEKEHVRARIKLQFSTLLSIPQFNLIFEEEAKQEFELCRKFLAEVVFGLNSSSGDQIQKTKKYLESIPNEYPSENPLNEHSFNPVGLNDWVHFLQRLSFNVFNTLNTELGKEAALKRFDNAYKKLSETYITLDSFQIIISMLPESMMDEQRFGTLSKQQVEKLLLKKADHFEQLNKDLLKKNEELERTQRKLIEAKNNAVKANKAKAMFLANMSHEIRTPMNAVIGMTEILRGTELTSEQLEYVETIYKSGVDLIHIINDILDYSKIESGRLDLENEPISMDQLIFELGNMMVFKSEKKNLELITHIDEKIPEFLIGDAVRIKQILTNLLSNAIKFTHEGEIILEVSPKKIEDGLCTLELSVSDTGIGIAKDKQRSIFDSFSQADFSTTRNYGGTGLGLAITKSLISLMKGRILLKSEVGEGSTFSCILTLPIKKTSKTNRTNADSLHGKKVICAIHNIEHCRYVSEKLKYYSIDTIHANFITEVLAELRKDSTTDFLLLEDKCIGIADETDIKELKELVSHKKISVISTYPFGQNLSKENPFSSFKLSKPINREELIKVLLKTQQQADPAKGLQPEKKQHQVRDIKVLVAEDTLVNQVVAKNLMKSIGYTIDIADNGKKVLELFEEQCYDLILMDVQMPEMDGIEATKELRLRTIKPRQPIIIAMTANATEEDKKMCLMAGMDDFSSKPVTRDQIVNKIEKWFPLS